MTPPEIVPAEPALPPGLLRPSERDEREVRFGGWSLRLTDGRLDDIRFGSARILRGVRVVVRDEDWVTFETTRVEAALEADALVIEGESSLGAARVEWTLRVGCSEQVLSADLEARVVTPFLRNRLGLIVLHGPECAGRSLVVRHPGGDSEHTAFPDRIAPHQPAREIAGLSWTADGVVAQLDLAGDVFEMEDQRNWTDASFKTYSTPLDLPFPVAVAPGDTIRQSLRLECAGAAPSAAPLAVERTVIVRAGAEGHPLPEILTSASSAPDSERAPHRSALGLLVECDVRWAGWRRALRRALDDARGRPVDLRIVARSPEEVGAVLDEVGDAPLTRLGAFAADGHRSEPELLAAVRPAARDRGAQVVGGVRSHFTELNRGAEALASTDSALAFSLTPFMHDRSGHQLVESLAVQRTVVRDAALLAAGRRLHLGPVTLGARMNAVATSPFDPGDADVEGRGYGPEATPGATDARQLSPALAAWVVGSLDALSAPAVDSLAYFEEWGPRGIATRDGLTPAGRVLEWAAELAGRPRLEIEAPGLAAVGGALGGERIVLLGNLGGRDVEVSLDAVAEWQSAIDGTARDTALVLAPGDAVRLRLETRPSGS